MVFECTPVAKSVTWRYAAIGTVFGLFFPVASIAMLLAFGAVTAPATVAGIVAVTHAHTPLLYVIDTAPLFLGLFAGLAGIRQTKVIALNASLEQQVAAKTASLRNALQQAEKANVLISHMADHDPLTGLLNRRRMHKELEAAASLAKRYGESFALVFVDLDRFKAVNDNHGHDAGDRYLTAFAAMLEQVARESDKLGRWGGDEFVALLPRSSRPRAEIFAERLRDGLGRQSVDIGPARITGAASIGIAEYPHDGADLEALLAHADRDMYRAKRGGDRSTRAEAAA